MIYETHRPAPGRLVEVGGYKLHLFSKGTGTLTVVIESGLAEGAMVWGLVQPEIAKVAQVVTYDRAGYGWSDQAPSPRSLDSMVTDLHTLLTNAEVTGPYILVGHSIGGLIMRLFASRYSEEVVGLVLVDALNEHLFTHAPTIYREWSKQLERTFHFLQLIARLGLFRLLMKLGQTNRMPELVTKQPKEQQAQLLAGGFLWGKNFATAREERLLFEPGTQRIREAALPKDIPLIVLTHGQPSMFASLPKQDAKIAEEIWQQSQAEVASRSSRGQLIIAEQSGHDIHIDRPDLVIQAIGTVLSASVAKTQKA